MFSSFFKFRFSLEIQQEASSLKRFRHLILDLNQFSRLSKTPHQQFPDATSILWRKRSKKSEKSESEVWYLSRGTENCIPLEETAQVLWIVGSGASRNMNGFQKSTTRQWNPLRILRIACPSVRGESDAKQGRKRKGSR